MQRRNGPRVLLAIVASALAVLPVTARAQDDLIKERAAAIVKRADDVQFGEVWGLSRELIELEGKDEVLARAIQQIGESAGDRGRLVSAKALLELTDQGVFADQVLGILKPVFDAKDPELRAAAASLLGDQSFANRANAKKEIRTILLARVTADTEAPKVRIEAAKALFQAGVPEDRATARAELRNFLKSSDRGLRTQGALALAAIDDMPSARAELDKVALEPTVEGELARAFLKRERMIRDFDQQMNRLAARKFGEENQKERSGKFALLAEIIGKVQAGHIRGDKFTEEELLNAAAGGILHFLDRHSSFLTSEEYSRFYFDLNREYGGIGAFVNDNDGQFQITRPIYSGPAYRKGLKSGDRITKVDGWDTAEKDLDEIIKKLKGKPGTKVIVSVWRPGWDKPRDYEINREEIHVPSVNYDLLPGGVGYAELVTFGANTAEELEQALTKLKAEGMRSLVLDVRNNTGGYLNTARDVAQLFVKKNSLIVETRSRIEAPEKLFSEREPPFPDLPIAVLVNGHTASASEIVAGALQDHKRATVVGVQSYGKGSVQNLLSLQTAAGEPYEDENKDRQRNEWESFKDLNKNGKYDPGPRMKLTMAMYYLPSGRCLHHEYNSDGTSANDDYGVIPDVVVDFQTEERKNSWKEPEITEMWNKGVLKNYVKERMEKNRDLFVKLAESDQGDFSQYPDFEEFYKSLNTHVTRDDVRRWLRIVMREEVSDTRGKVFPGIYTLGDFQEDLQLQAGTRAVMEKLGDRIEKIAEYKGILKELPAPASKPTRRSPRR
jgi:carboxyl-terminal processing protease